MNRILVSETVGKIGETVTGCRLGTPEFVTIAKYSFLISADRSGLLQVVSGAWAGESYEYIKQVGLEDVVQITGTVAARPENLVNPELTTGTVELQAAEVKI
jgi:aspartyl-tRNA synthetase